MIKTTRWASYFCALWNNQNMTRQQSSISEDIPLFMKKEELKLTRRFVKFRAGRE